MSKNTFHHMLQRHRPLRRWFGGAVAFLLWCTAVVWAQTTTFTYQGRLTDGGGPANGNYDLQFKLLDTPTVGSGAQQGGTLVRNPVVASAGIFTVTLDFGATVFDGADRFLEIGVRPSGSGAAYVVLSSRQPITSSPYTIQTLNAQQLGGLPANRYLAGAVNGNFGVGTSNPTGGRLHVEGDTGTAVFAHSNSSVGLWGTSTQFEGVRGEASDVNHGGVVGVHNAGGAGVYGTSTGVGVQGVSATGWGVNGVSTSGIGVYGTSAQFEGVRGEGSNINHAAVAGIHNAAGVGVYGTSTGAGVQGESSPGWGVVGSSTSSWGVVGTSTTSQGVHGESEGSSGFGVYAKNLNGIALGVEGHATQNRDRGGLVKAMIFVGADGTIVRCFNSFLFGSAATSGGCGFSIYHAAGAGSYAINFGFQVDDRFLNVTGLDNSSTGCLGLTTWLMWVSGTSIRVDTTCGGTEDGPFFVSVF